MHSLSVQELEVRSNCVVVIKQGMGSLGTNGLKSSESFFHLIV
jgi:hypothetical protein